MLKYPLMAYLLTEDPVSIVFRRKAERMIRMISEDRIVEPTKQGIESSPAYLKGAQTNLYGSGG